MATASLPSKDHTELGSTKSALSSRSWLEPSATTTNVAPGANVVPAGKSYSAWGLPSEPSVATAHFRSSRDTS
eukprot:scaffold3411_cov754-Pinguiococcus_pyrenoidosus.AAC.1